MAKGWDGWDAWNAWLVQHMAQRGWPIESTGSQRRLAEAGEITPSAISLWLDPAGPRPRPSIENCRRVAKAFNLSILTVMVAAQWITPEEARARPTPDADINVFEFNQLWTQAGQLHRELENERDELRDALKRAQRAHPEQPESKPRRSAKQTAGR